MIELWNQPSFFFNDDVLLKLLTPYTAAFAFILKLTMDFLN